MNRVQSIKEASLAAFRQARSNPDMTFDEFEKQLDSLIVQLEKTPSWKLRLLSGDGTWLDRLRLRRLNPDA